jgi:hypothetical protein
MKKPGAIRAFLLVSFESHYPTPVIARFVRVIHAFSP